MSVLVDVVGVVGILPTGEIALISVDDVCLFVAVKTLNEVADMIVVVENELLVGEDVVGLSVVEIARVEVVGLIVVVG